MLHQVSCQMDERLYLVISKPSQGYGADERSQKHAPFPSSTPATKAFS